MRVTIKPRLTLIGLLGFFSGLPYLLTVSTLTAWLSDVGVSRSSIGLFAAVGTPYTLKFLWSPLLDGVHIPALTKRFGRRRGWLLFTQILLTCSIFFMGFTNPQINVWLTALAAVMVATLSATQDMVIDAYRVELLEKEEQGTGAAWATVGYRIGMLVSGAGALALSFYGGWMITYEVMAAVMGLGVLLTLVMPEPEIDKMPRQGTTNIAAFLRDYVAAPFHDFIKRPMWKAVLAFVIIYKLGDAFMGIMFNPFLLDLGFNKLQIAQVVKLYGFIATILGTFAGGWLVGHAGMFRALILCGFTHMLTNLLLVMQAQIGANVHFLIYTISLENFTGGMSTSAFIAYLAALCNRNYTATQYALLSSLAAFGRTWLSTPSGLLSQTVGWEVFFAIASLMALPGMALLWWIETRKNRKMA